MRWAWAGADTGRQQSPGRAGPGGPGAGRARQGSPRTGPEAQERAAWRHLSPAMTGGQGGPANGRSWGPRPRSGGQRGPGVSGRAARFLSLCSTERDFQLIVKFPRQNRVFPMVLARDFSFQPKVIADYSIIQNWLRHLELFSKNLSKPT